MACPADALFTPKEAWWVITHLPSLSTRRSSSLLTPSTFTTSPTPSLRAASPPPSPPCVTMHLPLRVVQLVTGVLLLLLVLVLAGVLVQGSLAGARRPVKPSSAANGIASHSPLLLLLQLQLLVLLVDAAWVVVLHAALVAVCAVVVGVGVGVGVVVVVWVVWEEVVVVVVVVVVVAPVVAAWELVQVAAEGTRQNVTTPACMEEQQSEQSGQGRVNERVRNKGLQ
ncbi:unnamed protein product [Closterium sp. NIES-53]